MDSEFDVRAVGRLAGAAEKGLLSALEWMPYPSDLETEEAKTSLYRSLKEVEDALHEVRKARKWAEQQVINEAFGH